jgi:pilus assembly protein CpaB
MRRGGVLILLIGLILIVGAIALFLFLQGDTTGGLVGGGAAQSTVLPTEPPEVEIVRARVDIPANTVITDSVTLLEVVTISQTEFVADENLSSLSDVQGKLTTRSFRANEYIVASGLTDPGLSQQIPTAEPDRARDKAYPFLVNNLSGVADQIKQGDFVDVVATFTVVRPLSQPLPPTVPEGGQPPAPAGETGRTLTDYTANATKTLVQRAQVIRIVRPDTAAEATPADAAAAEAQPPAVDESGQPIEGAPQAAAGGTVTAGTWTLILAVNDQEVELMEFALASNARMTLVLRGAGDTAFEPTLGTTIDLLVSEFGLPLPRPLPARVVGPNEIFTPEPLPTAAPTRVP